MGRSDARGEERGTELQRGGSVEEIVFGTRDQAELFEAGLPCPEPLTGPVALVNGHATVESFLDAGEFRDTHDPTCRRLIAQALARHLAITGSADPPASLAGGWSLTDGDRLWPAHAHAPIFDLQSSSIHSALALRSHGATYLHS